jgi:hypothetical protein
MKILAHGLDHLHKTLTIRRLKKTVRSTEELNKQWLLAFFIFSANIRLHGATALKTFPLITDPRS